MSTDNTATQLVARRGSVDPWGRGKPEAAAALAEQAALVEKFNQQARDNWSDEAWHKEIAAVLSTALDYGFTFDNLFSQYFQTETVGEFDEVTLRERRGLKVFYTSRGGYIEESQITDEVWRLPRDTMGFHVSEHIDKLRANFATKFDDLISLGQQRLGAEVNRRIFSLLQQAVPSGHASYVATTGLTKPEVDTALREVEDAIKPNGLGPVPVTIIGRASMTSKITDFNLGFDPEATAEIRATGRLGVYRGATLVRVVNYTDEDGLAYIPANELWIFGGTVGKFAMYGGLQVKTWEENTVDYRHYRARKDVGGLVHHPEQARRLVDSSVTP